jgi:hypothetical protein
LAGAQSSEEVAKEVRKRLTTIARSRSFIDWQNRKGLIEDLEAQRRAIVNQVANCSPLWNGGNYASATAPGVLHFNSLLGQVSWDVTSDVLAGANFGWTIRKREENQNGQVRYYSREGAALAGNANLAPRLVLVYSH